MNDLYQTLLEKIKSSNTEQYQFKPIEHQLDITQKMSRINVDNQLQTIKKDYRTQLDKQIYNIAQNIVFNFFSLSDDKFYAIILRTKAWGLAICIQQFIMHYYLFLKNNNRLRQFVILHFNKIVLIVCSIIQKQLITKINLQSFKSSNKELKQLEQDLVATQKQIEDQLPQEQIKNKIVQPIKTEDDAAKLKADILADLKATNTQIESI